MYIIGTKVDNVTAKHLAKYIKSCLNDKKDVKHKVSKINAEFLQRALHDKNFSKVLNESDINIVDGRGVLWAARYLTLPISKNRYISPIQAIWQMIYSGACIVLNHKFIEYPISEAIPGVDAFNIVLESAADNKSSIFLFGGLPEVLEKAAKNIQKEFPKLKISGALNGYDFQKRDNDINPIAEINKTDAKILIVALGSPRQEYWINDNINRLKNIKIAIGEGGTLDRIANPSQKSPRVINKIGLEWFWRLSFNKSKTDSRNRFGRFWNSVPNFIYQVIKWKVKNGQTKI